MVINSNYYNKRYFHITEKKFTNIFLSYEVNIVL